MSNQTIEKEIISAIVSAVSFKTTAEEPNQQLACLRSIANTFADDLSAVFYEFNDHPALVLSNHEGKDSDVIISGHIDVVPGKDALFSMQERDGKLFGRGVYDMKGPLLASLMAVRDIVRAGTSKKISVLITADEETSGNGTKGLLGEGYKADFALLPDGGGESEIIIAQKGFLQLAVSISGRSAHASRPWEGHNPIKTAAAFLNTVAENFATPSGLSDWKTSVTPTKLVGGTVVNQIPDMVTIYLDIRFVSPSDPSAMTQWIEETLGEQCANIDIVGENGMFEVSPDDSQLLRPKDCLEKTTGSEVSLTRECGTSDAIFFAEHGIPAALFRPEGGEDHGDGEWVSVASLEKTYQTIRHYLKEDR